MPSHMCEINVTNFARNFAKRPFICSLDMLNTYAALNYLNILLI